MYNIKVSVPVASTLLTIAIFFGPVATLIAGFLRKETCLPGIVLFLWQAVLLWFFCMGWLFGIHTAVAICKNSITD